MSEWVRVLWQDFLAWRRREHRVVPRRDVNGRITQGRVYARRADSSGTIATRARLRASMSLRVYRAATDTWEPPIEIPAKVEEKR